MLTRSIGALVLGWLAAGTVFGQQLVPSPAARVTERTRFGFTTLVKDHALLWSAPVRARGSGLGIMMPFLAAGVVSTRLDHGVESRLPRSPGAIHGAKVVSVAGAYYSLAAVGGGFIAAGAVTRNRRAIETGLLSAAAVAHTESIAQMLKYGFGRERPDYGDPARGRFWKRQQSFPSGHAMGTWAVATVISKEYHDNPWIRYGVYAFPVAISAARLGAQRHFLSDVVIGAGLGRMLGAWLYERHHNPDLGGAPVRRRGVTITPDVAIDPSTRGVALRLNVSR